MFPAGLDYVNLLHCIGVVLPSLLDGQDLIRESRAIERMCWRELGYEKQPIFDGELPAFLMVNAGGLPINLSIATDPVELATRMAALEPTPLPAASHVGANLDTLARLLNFTPFESQWLRWSYCIRRFGGAILPVLPVRNANHGCNVLARLAISGALWVAAGGISPSGFRLKTSRGMKRRC